MICETIYFDKAGNKSADYYGNLHLGHAAALKIYLTRNAQNLGTKFQHGLRLDLEGVKDWAKGNREEFKKYKDSRVREKSLTSVEGITSEAENKVTKSARRLIESQKDPFQEDQLAQDVVRNRWIREAFEGDIHQAGAYLHMFQLTWDQAQKVSITKLKEEATYADFIAEVDQKIAANQAKFEADKEHLKAKWEFTTEKGKEYHDVIEKYVRAYIDGTYVTKRGDIDHYALEMFAAQNNTAIRGSMEKLFPQLREFIDNLKKAGIVHFELEMPMYNPELDLWGVVDLAAFDKHGQMYIFDWKTREEGKGWSFDRPGKRMHGSFSKLFDNLETFVELQSSFYRIMAELAGIKVMESAVVQIEGKLVGSNAFNMAFDDFRIDRVRRLRYHRAEIKNHFLSREKNPINIDKGYADIGADIQDAISKLTKGQGLEDSLSIEDRVKYRLDNLYIDEETGKEYFRDYHSGYPKKIYFEPTDTTEYKRSILTKYYKEDVEMQKNLSNHVIKFFEDGMVKWPVGGKSKMSSAYADQALNTLAGLHPETHRLEKLINIPGFETMPHDILIAIDKQDGSGRIINLTRAPERWLKLEDKIHNKDRGIFASFMTDRGYKVNYGQQGLKSTDTSYRMLRNGLIAMELQRIGFIKGVTGLVVAPVTGRVDQEKAPLKPIATNMNVVLQSLRVMKSVLGDQLKEGVINNLTNRELLTSSTYNIDYLDQLYDMVVSGFEGLYGKRIEALTEKLLDVRGNEHEVMRTLLEIRKFIIGTLTTRNEAELLKNKNYRLISMTILQLADVNLNIGDTSERMAVENRHRTGSRIAERAVQILEAKIQATEQKINIRMQEFRIEHKKVFDALKKSKSVLGIGMDTHGLFRDMYIIDPHKELSEHEKAQKVDNLYRLKTKGSAEYNKLTKEEQDYIDFFNKWIRKGFESILDTETLEHMDEGLLWEKGTVPLMNAGLATRREMEDDLKEKLRISLKGMFNARRRESAPTYETLTTFLDNKFSNQLNDNARRTMLGVDSAGEVIADYDKKLETNLEQILAHFMTENLRSEEYNQTIAIYDAMNLVMMVDSHEFFNGTDEVRTFMKDFVTLKIMNQHKDDGEFGRQVDNLGKLMSAVALGLSPRQMVLELSTNMFANFSDVLQQAMLSKDNKRFTMSAWTQAGAMIIGDKAKGYTSKDLSTVQAIVGNLGLYHADSEAQARVEKLESRKNGWWQSKWLYFLNNLPYRNFKTQTVLAELITKGIIDVKNPSWYLDDTGHLKYNPAKDPRWEGIFADRKGQKLKDIARPKESYEENPNHVYYRQKKYESFLRDMEHDGMVDEHGVPTRPVTIAEVTSIKDYALSVYSSVDKDSKAVATISAWGRIFMKFKEWMTSKKDSYWTTRHLSEIRGERVWIKDDTLEDGGYWDWQYDDVEGIIQTLGFMLNGVREAFRGENKYQEAKMVFQGMDKIRRRNMAKLGSDIMLSLILTLFLRWAFDDDKFKSGPGKVFSQSVINSISDINIILMSDDLARSGPAATAGFLSRGITHFGMLLHSTITGDFEESAKRMRKVVELSGLGRTIASFTDIKVPEE